MILSRAQIERLAEIIRQHTTWFAWRVFGEQEISEKDLQRLKHSGKLPMDVSVSSIKYSYVLGKLESLLKEGEYKRLTWEQLQEAARGRYTSIDKYQIDAAELSAHTKFRNLLGDIQDGLYQRMSDATNRVITEGNIRETIADKIRTGVDLSQAYTKVASELVESLKETKRNWERVAATEMHAARQRGIAAAIIQKEDIYADSDGVDSNVAVVHDSDMCEDCRRVYYDPKTGNPKVFRLRELLENEGSNYKRPWRVNAKPVVPPLHPHCFGRLRYVPLGWGWDDNHQFTLLDPSEAYPELIGKSLIDFPEHEHEQLRNRLDSGKDIYTTRIMKERNKYKEGHIHNSPFGKLKVISVKTGQGLHQHPFVSELTTDEKKQISNNPFDLVQLRKL